MADRIIVTLIHGTWARGAPWTRQGSMLRAAIADAFPGKVEFWPPELLVRKERHRRETRRGSATA